VNHKRFLGTLPPEPVLLKTTIAGSSTRVFAEAGASFAIRGAFCAAMARVTVGSPLTWFRASAPPSYIIFIGLARFSSFKAIAQSGSTQRQLPEELPGQLVSLARGMAREGIMTIFSSTLGSINHHPCYRHTVNKPLATTLGWIQGTHTQNVVDDGSLLVFTVPAPCSRAAERNCLEIPDALILRALEATKTGLLRPVLPFWAPKETLLGSPLAIFQTVSLGNLVNKG
jgi:hypothetical protein